MDGAPSQEGAAYLPVSKTSFLSFPQVFKLTRAER